MHRYPGAQPTWSSDSQKLAIKTCAPACGLWQVNFDGSEAKPLTTDGTDSYPTWSPTGQFLAFTSRRDGNWEIYLLRLDDNSLQRLTNRPATDVTPVFSPNGQEIYLRTDDQGGGDAWRITAITIDGSSERLVKEGVGPSDDWGLARPAIR
jgi:TolB protein